MQALHNVQDNARVCIIGIKIGIRNYAKIMQIMQKLCKKCAENNAKLCNNMHIMQITHKLCRNYAKTIMQKLCKNYAEIMQKLCKNYANYAKIMQIMQVSKHYAHYASPTLLLVT